MRPSHTRTLALWCALQALGAGAAVAQAPGQASPPAGPVIARMADVYAKGLQGDMAAGLDLLGRIPEAGLTAEDQAARKALLERFEAGKAPALDIPEPFTREVATLFLGYWRRGLLGLVRPAEGEAELFDALNALLARYGRTVDGAASLGDLDEALHARLREDGYFALTGRTPPFRELMLWRRETVRDYQVELPESTQDVKVVFLVDFRLLGWAGYATADAYHSAGWAKPDALYCVQESYDLDSESFRVSYLAHEAQHFADGRQFPDLEAPELEYRAKLVELGRADETLPGLLDQFSRQASDDRASPHAFANFRAMRRISQRLSGDDSAWQDPAKRAAWEPSAIRKVALELLLEDSKELLAR